MIEADGGYLTRDGNLSRSIDIKIDVPEATEDFADESDNVVPIGDGSLIPLVGSIAAGGPITAEQNVEQYFAIPRQLTGKGDLFLLKVKGDSMIDAAICDGDYVVVRQQKTADNGDIVAALTGTVARPL